MTAAQRIRHREIPAVIEARHLQTGPLVGLRNAVMHPTRDLIGRGRSLDTLVGLEAALMTLMLRLEAQELHAHERAEDASSIIPPGWAPTAAVQRRTSAPEAPSETDTPREPA